MTAPRKRGFDPVVDADTRLLILGSLPGDASIARREYYAHPTNGFWTLIGDVIGDPGLRQLSYADRLAALKRHGVGLWDVIVEAERIGSLDSSIRLPEYADLHSLAAALPNLRAVAFNGGRSAAAGTRHLADMDERIARIALPSSSAAHARMPPDAKRAAWSVLKTYLAD